MMLNRDRYQNDLRRIVGEFLDAHLNDADEHGGKWKRVGGRVDVLFTYPGTPPEKGLTRPQVIIGVVGDEVTATLLNSAYRQHYGEYHQVALSLQAMSDGNTGGELAATEVATAMQLCFADHGSELESAGIAVLDRLAELPEYDADTGIFTAPLRVLLDVQVMGQAVRTLELELGRFTFTGTGQGTFQEGATLDMPHKLRMKLLTGTGLGSIPVTVRARDQDGATRRLYGNIAGGRAAGTYIALADERPEDEYTSVVTISVGGQSGRPGEAFSVVNIPKELI